MIRIALVGLGKMGVLRHDVVNSTDGLKLVATWDSTPLIGTLVGRYTGIKSYSSYRQMLDEDPLDYVLTPQLNDA